MSALGQTRRFGLLTLTSGLTPTSDISRLSRHFAFVPLPEVASGRLEIDEQREFGRLFDW